MCLYLYGIPSIGQTNTTQINTIKLIQTELPTGLGDTGQRILAIKISTTNTTSSNTVNALKFTMAGTTNIADVSNIKVYSSGANAIFNPATANLFGTVKPSRVLWSLMEYKH